MHTSHFPDDFYEKIKPRLHKRVGREIRLARRVLDIGCGSCELVRYLAETYCQEVTGVDVSSKPFPARRCTPGGVRFRCVRQSASNLHFAADHSIDAAVFFWVLHEMEHPDSVLAETRRVLRPGGKVLIVEFPKDSLADQLWGEKYYRPDQIESLLTQSGFKETTVRLIERKQIIWACAHRPGKESERTY